MIKYLKILTTSILLFPLWGLGGIFAQNFPVQCTPIVTPPYTLSWVEYGSSPERLKVQLLLKDLTKPSVEVSLRIRLKGIGVVIENTPDFYTSSPITLLPGVPVVLSGAMLQENFKYENLTAQGVDLEALYAGASLPSGFYQWEITAFLADQRQVSNVGMAMMTVFKNNPPQITFPQNNAVLMNTGFQSINFTWMPRHRYSTNAAAGTVYTFKIYEIPNEEGAGDASQETDPNIIVNSGVLPLFSTQSFGTNYTYKPSDPLLVPGRRYVIQVQAADINGNDEFENNGLSEVSTFSFGNPSEVPAMKLCKVPKNFLAEKLDEQSVQFTWQETNSEAPIDYLVSYKTENEGVWTERIVQEQSLTLIQLAPAKYQFRVSARCTYDNKSTFTTPESIELSKPEAEKEIPEAEPQDTYVNTDEPVTPPSTYEPETEPEPAIDELNTPIKILLEPTDETETGGTGTGGTGTSTNPKPPKGYEDVTSIPVLPANPTLEQLKTGLKTKKTDCAALLVNYQCGQNDIPSVPSGDIIQPNVGDEIAINSIGFEVVELDGSGNGRGIVKVPMFQNAKFGVEFKGIKVAKGGCVVAGQAELSNVDVALLNEEQRKKLAETYEAFNKVLDVVDANAEGVAETFNSVWALMDGIKDRAAKLAAKLSSGQNPSAKEIKDLAKLTENSAAMLQKSLNDIKKQAQANADAGKVDEMQKIIDQQKASAKALLASAKDIKVGKDKLPTPQDPLEKANTQKQVDALAMTNGADVKKKLDGLTSNIIAVEYNTKLYSKSGTKIKMMPGQSGGVVQPDNEIKLNCGFYLKNNLSGEAISWKLETTDGKELSLEEPLRISASKTDTYFGIKWPIEHKSLTLTVKSGERTLVLNLEKPNWSVNGLTVSETKQVSYIKKRINTRTAKEGQILYIIQDNSGGVVLDDRKLDYKYQSNVEDILLKKYITHYDYTNNSSSSLENSISPIQHKLRYTYDKVPHQYGLGIKALGYDKSVKVQLIPFDKREDESAIPIETLLSLRKLAKSLKEIKKFKTKLEDVIGKQEEESGKEVGFEVVANGQTYNEEIEESKDYFSVKEWEAKFVGSVGYTFKYGVTTMLPKALTKYVDVYVYAGISVDGEIIGGEKRGKRNGVGNDERIEIAQKVQVVGGVKIGATVKVNAGNLAKVDLDANGKGEIEGGYNFATKKGFAVLKPIVFNLSASVSTLGVEIYKYNYIKNITNEYPIYNP